MLGIAAGISACAGKGTGEHAVELERQALLWSFWRSAAGFWGACGASASWLLSAILLLIVLLNLAASYGMNVWHRVVFDALQAQDSSTVLQLSVLYVPLLAASVLLSVIHVCARMTMQRRWREWVNKFLAGRWLDNGRYYRLNVVGGADANPECRIADDVRNATAAPIEFATGATAAVL